MDSAQWLQTFCKGGFSGTLAAVEQLEAEVVGKQKTIIELARKVDRFRNHLESLTPGGSEFHNDPVRCVEWVHEQTSSVISQVLKRKAAEAENARLREACENALDSIGIARMCCTDSQIMSRGTFDEAVQRVEKTLRLALELSP